MNISQIPCSRKRNKRRRPVFHPDSMHGSAETELAGGKHRKGVWGLLESLRGILRVWEESFPLTAVCKSRKPLRLVSDRNTCDTCTRKAMHVIILPAPMNRVSMQLINANANNIHSTTCLMLDTAFEFRR